MKSTQENNSDDALGSIRVQLIDKPVVKIENSVKDQLLQLCWFILKMEWMLTLDDDHKAGGLLSLK